MKAAIMQPYIFPYIGYFQLINAVDKFVFLDDVNFINKGWINRNFIQNKGDKILFTIPLKGASQNELIKNIFVSEEGNWRKKLLATIALSYKKAPYYEERFTLIESIINTQNVTIAEYAKNSIMQISAALHLKAEFIRSSSIFEKINSGEDRILDICVKLGATTYINPQGGTELYNKEKFNQKSIALNFLFSGQVNYNQNHAKDFVPHLSIIDILMYNNNQQIVDLLNNNFELK
jgi:hypothetical protein